MVAAFSVGLALTLIAIGLAVEWGSGKLAKLFPNFDRYAQRLPYLSAAAGYDRGGGHDVRWS